MSSLGLLAHLCDLQDDISKDDTTTKRRRVRAKKMVEKRQHLNDIRKLADQPNEVRKSSDEGGHTVSFGVVYYS